MNKFILLCGGVFAAGVLVVLLNIGSEATSQPIAVEDTPVAVAGNTMVQVNLPAEFNNAAQIGKIAFEASCAACHGINAAGTYGVAPPLVHKIYEPSHHGDMAFVLAAQNGVRAHHWNFGDMPPIAGLTRGDLGNIVAYVRSLQRENGIH